LKLEFAMTGAITIFVKTVGLSPVKTRLAQAIGHPAAETFHRLAAAAVAAVIRQAAVKHRLTPYWAVAEPQGMTDPAWQSFPQILQGEGNLGTRLAWVYNQLLQHHRFVLMLGADSPQISLHHLSQATIWAEAGYFTLGPAADGGFYLFGGCQPIPRFIWESIPYSSSQTAQSLIQAIAPLGPVQQLSPLLDVDTVQELQQVQAQLNHATRTAPTHQIGEFKELCLEQATLLDWINHLFSEAHD